MDSNSKGLKNGRKIPVGEQHFRNVTGCKDFSTFSLHESCKKADSPRKSLHIQKCAFLCDATELRLPEKGTPKVLEKSYIKYIL